MSKWFLENNLKIVVKFINMFINDLCYFNKMYELISVFVIFNLFWILFKKKRCKVMWLYSKML